MAEIFDLPSELTDDDRSHIVYYSVQTSSQIPALRVLENRFAAHQRVLDRVYDSDGESVNTDDLPPLEDLPTTDTASNQAVIGSTAPTTLLL